MNIKLDLTKLTNQKLGQLKALIDNEVATRESDDGFSKAYLSGIPPTGPKSCFDNALKWDWLNYIKQYGAYDPESLKRDMSSFSKLIDILNH